MERNGHRHAVKRRFRAATTTRRHAQAAQPLQQTLSPTAMKDCLDGQTNFQEMQRRTGLSE